MNKIDTQEHFTVPEGYFENFTEHMMSILPEQEFQPMHGDLVEETKTEQKKRTIPMWSRYVAAACVIGVLFISAFTVFYRGSDKTTEQGASPIAAVTTTIADSSKKVIEAVAPTAVKEQPVLAKAEIPVARAKAKSVKHTASVPAPKEKATTKTQHSAKQSYDVDVNVGYDQNDVERAAMYLGIDNQDMCEMMYEGL